MQAIEPVTAKLLKIGELHLKSRISIKTIRYYEQLGLIDAARRSQGGFRLFKPETLTRLTFIKQAQSLGLSLQEIRELLAIRDRGKLPCDEVKHKFEVKISEIDRRIEQLQDLKTKLQSLVAEADPVPEQPIDGVICPIVQKA